MHFASLYDGEDDDHIVYVMMFCVYMIMITQGVGEFHFHVVNQDEQGRSLSTSTMTLETWKELQHSI